jgi:iron complex transport system permease protein
VSERLRFVLLLVVLGSLGAILLLAGVLHGASDLGPGEVLRALLAATGLGGGDVDPVTQRIILDLRLPRVLVAWVIGAALAMSGACLQAMFRNPMADPGVIGVGAGASLGAVAMIYAGLGAAWIWAIPLGAFAGAVITTLVVYALATRGGQTQVTLLLLIGIAMNFLLGALTALLLHTAFRSQGYEIGRHVLLWTMGGLGDRTWDHLAVLVPLVLVGTAALAVNVRPLDPFLLGEEQAAGRGVPVQAVKLQLVAATALLTAAAVAFAGVIAFVGLVTPHMVRIGVGPTHRRLLPACALGGGAFVCAADLVARSVVAPEQLPLGVVSGLVGAPFFLYLLVRSSGRVTWS